MRKYEVMIIIDPTVEERQVDSLMEKYLRTKVMRPEIH